MRFTMERRPLLRVGAKPLKRMVGVPRFELGTPAMSKRVSCRHVADFRYHPLHTVGICSHLFPFISHLRFKPNFGPLLQKVAPALAMGRAG